MAYTPEMEFYKKRQFGDKINATFTFLRENAWFYIKQQLIVAGPILLIVNILMNRLSVDFFGFAEGEFTADMLISFFQVYGLALIANLITATLVPIITFNYMKAYQQYPPAMINTQMVTKNLGTKFFMLFGFNLIAFFLILIGFFIFLIPGIYLAIVMALGSSIIVFEDNNPIDAIGRAFTLIKGKWWSTFGLLLVMTLIGYVISALFGLPRTIVFGLKAFTTAAEGGELSTLADMSLGEEILSIVFSVLETFGSILLYSLTYMTMAFQYFNLVERRESRGLMTKIEGMDVEQDDDDDTF